MSVKETLERLQKEYYKGKEKGEDVEYLNDAGCFLLMYLTWVTDGALPPTDTDLLVKDSTGKQEVARCSWVWSPEGKLKIIWNTQGLGEVVGWHYLLPESGE